MIHIVYPLDILSERVGSRIGPDNVGEWTRLHVFDALHLSDQTTIQGVVVDSLSNCMTLMVRHSQILQDERGASRQLIPFFEAEKRLSFLFLPSTQMHNGKFTG